MQAKEPQALNPSSDQNPSVTILTAVSLRLAILRFAITNNMSLRMAQYTWKQAPLAGTQPLSQLGTDAEQQGDP